MSDVTHILSGIERGDPHAPAQLLTLVYDELRRLAAQKMASENAGQTLQATALVHEAYLRLVDVEEAQHWNSRGHFFAAAAEAMRRLLVENARRKNALQRGGDRARLDIDLAEQELPRLSEDILALNLELSPNSPDSQAPLENPQPKLRFALPPKPPSTAKKLAVSGCKVTILWNEQPQSAFANSRNCLAA